MSNLLYQDIEGAYDYVPKPKIPLCIASNLKHTLRTYQEEALENFIFYHSLSQKHKDLPHKHLLFHMATGSGKTNIIASTILYLYEQGYRDFIFFVNTNNIITKTKENLVNFASSKYLFTEQIRIKNKEVKVNVIEDTFDVSRADDINILFTTINKLHIDLETTIKENSITYADFKDRKIVMIADEAHHLNANTKSQKESEKNWERTTQNLLKANAENILLEFTATQDLSNVNVADKYRDKIIYDYALKKFRDDGYSKEIKLISDNFDDKKRMLQAVMISEYRRMVAQKELNLSIKPVIMFKSVKNTVDADALFETFVTLVEQLSVEDIDDIFKHSGLEVMAKLEAYIEDKEQFVKGLQYGFSKQNCLVIHSKVKDKELKLQNLNSLEDERNKIRAIFAVDILNEGWDVLNLFDIVKLDEAKKTTSSTVSEAQLIGRGARYFPFEYNEELELSDDMKLKYIVELLEQIEKGIVKNANTYVGSCEFYPVRISQKIPPTKQLKLKESDSPIHRVEDWYIFEPHNGTIEEMHFVEFIKASMSELKKCYADIRLIRNEKAFDIFSFDKAQDGAKFEPDFILLLQDKEGCYHQIFCEPKGEFLFLPDAWKNEFLQDITKCTKDNKLALQDINDKSLPMYENSCYKILGLPFYNNALESEFKVEFEELILS